MTPRAFAADVRERFNRQIHGLLDEPGAVALDELAVELQISPPGRRSLTMSQWTALSFLPPVYV